MWLLSKLNDKYLLSELIKTSLAGVKGKVVQKPCLTSIIANYKFEITNPTWASVVINTYSFSMWELEKMCFSQNLQADDNNTYIRTVVGNITTTPSLK